MRQDKLTTPVFAMQSRPRWKSKINWVQAWMEDKERSRKTEKIVEF